MNLNINCECPHCSQVFKKLLEPGQNFNCPHCQKGQWTPPPINFFFKQCLICGCDAFYRQKHFNRKLGCLLLGGGIALTPWTYGLSLPVLALLDWLVRKHVPDSAVCYLCRTEFSDIPIPETFEDFNHFLAFKFEKKRAEIKKI